MKSAMKWSRKGVALGLALCSGLIASAAARADVYVKETGLTIGEATNSLQLPVNPGGPLNFWAGFQTIDVSMTSNGASPTSFQAYCVDPAHYSTSSYSNYISPSVTSDVATAFSAQVAANINNLYNNYYTETTSGSSDNRYSAAFQTALWAILYGQTNVDNNNVLAVHTNGSTVANLDGDADYMLSHLAYSGSNLYDLTLYQVDRTNGGVGQNYLVASPAVVVTGVPEPESYAMILAGLGMFGFIATRRRRN